MKELIKKFLPSKILDFYHFILPFLGALIYRFPSGKIKVIGVTGTNGKTTTTEMIARIFEKAGYKVALLNSIRFKIGDEEKINDLRMTMPGRFFIQRFLRKAVNKGCQYAILEVTSEGIKQYRHKFINFEIAVFTNLSPEHIESHGGFENYKKAKGKLFQVTKNIHVINADDANANYFLQFPAKTKYQFKIQNSKGKITIQNSKSSKEIVNFKLNLKMPGDFNIYNALAAICVGLSQGISFETCKEVLENFEGVPGRMELVIEKPFKVIVDYAFTPEALEKVYSTLANLYKCGHKSHEFAKIGDEIRENSRENKFAKIGAQIRANSRKMICVLGACGGGRDKWKRPVLGEIAAKYCNEIIVTNEDPYDEDPYQILSQIKSGIQNSKFKMQNFYEILDRRMAINKALSLAVPGDTVIITGKGCEPSICIKDKKIPWDDRKVVREEFEKLLFKNKIKK